jgi:4-hydroxy-3-methylbut-2-enyl diphosphate reductase
VPARHVAHRAVAALAREGYHVVIVGQRDHVEVRGLTGDLDRFDVVLEDDDVLALEEHPRLGVAAQTTQAVEKVRHLVDLIRRRFPQSDVRFSTRSASPPRNGSPRRSRWHARPTSSSWSAAGRATTRASW